MAEWTANYTQISSTQDRIKQVLFMDIDSTLYSASCGISEHMGTLIQDYFEAQGLSKEEATHLHQSYFRQYGLSIRGLIKHHQIEPLDYDRNCDQKLPLEQLLAPNPDTQNLLRSLDRSKVRLIALTNAYKTHAIRVLRILDLYDDFEAVMSCDYTHPDFKCKPELPYFQEALARTGVACEHAYFVDDSALNVRGALDAGWKNSLLLLEADDSFVSPVLSMKEHSMTPQLVHPAIHYRPAADQTALAASLHGRRFLTFAECLARIESCVIASPEPARHKATQ